MKEVQNYSDRELVQVYSNQAEYQNWLVKDVLLEIERREVDIESELRDYLNEISKKEQEPLSWGLRLFFFFFPLGVFQWVFAYRFESQGNKRKAKESWYSMYLGLAFYLILILFLN